MPFVSTTGSGALGSSTSAGIVVSLGIAFSTGLGAIVVGGALPSGASGGAAGGTVVAVVVVGPPGVGRTPLTNLARHSLPGRYSRTGLRVGATGAGQSSSGSGATAGSIIAPQMRAGYVAPCTLPTPMNSGTLIIGVYASGSPTHTAVVSCGEAPTNQELVLSCWVPVLPAAGKGKLAKVLAAVPCVSTPFKVATAVNATSGSSTCTPGSSCVYNRVPSALSM